MWGGVHSPNPWLVAGVAVVLEHRRDHRHGMIGSTHSVQKIVEKKKTKKEGECASVALWCGLVREATVRVIFGDDMPGIFPPFSKITSATVEKTK